MQPEDSYNNFSFTEYFNKKEASSKLPTLEIDLDFQDEFTAENITTDSSLYERSSTPIFDYGPRNFSMSMEDLERKTWNDFFYEYFAISLKQPAENIQLRGTEQHPGGFILAGHIVPEKMKKRNEIADPPSQKFLDFMKLHYGLSIDKQSKCNQNTVPCASMPDLLTENDFIRFISTKNVLSQYLSLPADVSAASRQPSVLQPAHKLENLAELGLYTPEKCKQGFSRIPRRLKRSDCAKTPVQNIFANRLQTQAVPSKVWDKQSPPRKMGHQESLMAIDRDGRVVNLRDFLSRLTVSKHR